MDEKDELLAKAYVQLKMAQMMLLALQVELDNTKADLDTTLQLLQERSVEKLRLRTRIARHEEQPSMS